MKVGSKLRILLLPVSSHDLEPTFIIFLSKLKNTARPAQMKTYHLWHIICILVCCIFDDRGRHIWFTISQQQHRLFEFVIKIGSIGNQKRWTNVDWNQFLSTLCHKLLFNEMPILLKKSYIHILLKRFQCLQKRDLFH